ncbi:hypothetical protein [Sphingomonas lenta]|uniref:Uncharacterized protein n=1 Tax=Sphingomonas lenta TaxID=1141887 RepID=A0A2A2SBV3_9SPHN|nr:hypothetical protein [Sphingomonas lenta]PAX06675.1 hypothetical protein CKY28_16205 [Sphingomonas lenta]
MMLITLALLMQEAPVLGPIGRQALPSKGCAAYLWNNGPKRQLVAMATAEPGVIRLHLDGKTVDVARAEARGAAGFGFAGTTEYRGPDVMAVLDMTVQTRGDLSGGAVVPAATLRVERPGRDVLVAPVAGLIGCV